MMNLRGKSGWQREPALKLSDASNMIVFPWMESHGEIRSYARNVDEGVI
jgi:hypothetical protein